MDLLLAITRALLLFLEKEDHKMSILLAKSFLTIDAMYHPEK
jgi:hypothetical protein